MSASFDLSTQSAHPAVERVLSRLTGVRRASRGWVACCPAHGDREPSLSIGIGEEGQVLLKCFAGCSLEAIVSAAGMCVADLFPGPQITSSDEQIRSSGSGHSPLTLLDLAQDKQLPWQFLFHLGVMDNDRGSIDIPYHLADGSLASRHRIRTALTAKEGSYWSKGQGEIVPYGLEQLAEARKAGYLILVEGESDCWTLWYHHFPALGLPGAEMVCKLREAMLEGIERLYVMQEPDAGGTAFVTHISQQLEAWHWQGKAFIITLAGAKDPNELYQQEKRGFHQAFQRALQQAEPLFFFRSSSATTTEASNGQHAPAIFSLQDLLSWELPPVRWAIPDILPEGLTLLAGKPKLGKSWLALSTALAIAAGGVALGKQPVTQGQVLYLALEDNARRLQARSRQLLNAMTGVPQGIEFALSWPRLNEGGVECLETYIKEHPDVRLIVIDTWAKVAPRTTNRSCSQYAGDYEALTPLKTLADTYHVSILAVHHLRKMGSSDVLDEITGSIGITGAVDGTLILKRERGKPDATLFVTGRDIEQEQHLALSFDATTALWTVVGNAEEVCRSKKRQEILDLLTEHFPDGMGSREIAEALDKNYHTTRTLLRKMEEAGDITSSARKYMALSGKKSEDAPMSPCRRDASNDIDYGDYDDDSDDTDVRNTTRRINTAEAKTARVAPVVSPAVSEMTSGTKAVNRDIERHEDQSSTHPSLRESSIPYDRRENNTITGIKRNQYHHGNQSLEAGTQEAMQTQETTREKNTSQTDSHAVSPYEKQRCPHHPYEQRVRFDPTGQAWCDRLDCWGCYRLMHIGEALGYPCLIDRGGECLIEDGQDAWFHFTRAQRAFLIMLATEEAIISCHHQGIAVPDLSAEALHLNTIHPLFPPSGSA